MCLVAKGADALFDPCYHLVTFFDLWVSCGNGFECLVRGGEEDMVEMTGVVVVFCVYEVAFSAVTEPFDGVSH